MVEIYYVQYLLNICVVVLKMIHRMVSKACSTSFRETVAIHTQNIYISQILCLIFPKVDYLLGKCVGTCILRHDEILKTVRNCTKNTGFSLN